MKLRDSSESEVFINLRQKCKNAHEMIGSILRLFQCYFSKFPPLSRNFLVIFSLRSVFSSQKCAICRNFVRLSTAKCVSCRHGQQWLRSTKISSTMRWTPPGHFFDIFFVQISDSCQEQHFWGFQKSAPVRESELLMNDPFVLSQALNFSRILFFILFSKIFFKISVFMKINLEQIRNVTYFIHPLLFRSDQKLGTP